MSSHGIVMLTLKSCNYRLNGSNVKQACTSEHLSKPCLKRPLFIARPTKRQKYRISTQHDRSSVNGVKNFVKLSMRANVWSSKSLSRSKLCMSLKKLEGTRYCKSTRAKSCSLFSKLGGSCVKGRSKVMNYANAFKKGALLLFSNAWGSSTSKRKSKNWLIEAKNWNYRSMSVSKPPRMPQTYTNLASAS